MKLPAFFGHKRSINLLPRDSFESSPMGIILEWSLVFGKWAVILTQLVVMGAFLYRITLDRTLTDLRKSIAKDSAVVKSYDQVERDFTLAQKQIAQAKLAMSSQKILLSTVTSIAQSTPSEVWYDRLSLTPSTVTISAFAASLPGFGTFLTAIQSNPQFNGVRLGKLESSTTKGASIQFDLSLSLASAPNVLPGAKK